MDHKKRKTPEPMVEGVKFKGFLNDSKWILKKFSDNAKKRNAHMDMMCENAGEHLLENSDGIAKQGFKGVVQFVHTLFEIAAAVTNAADGEGQDGEKLEELHEHAMQGLAMIGGEEIDDDCDDE